MSTNVKITHAQARKRLAESLALAAERLPVYDLGRAVAYLVSAAGAVVAVTEQDTSDGITREGQVEEVLGYASQCFELSGTELGPQHAGGETLDPVEARVVLINRAATLHHYYHRSAAAFEAELRRLWYFLLQHEEVLTHG